MIDAIPSWKHRHPKATLIGSVAVFFLALALPATSQSHRIDTLWNVGNSHPGYGLVLSPDGQTFVTTSVSHVHAVRPIEQPYTVMSRCTTGIARRNLGITLPLGLTPDGDMIVEGGNMFDEDANGIMRWKPGSDTLMWHAKDLSYGEASHDGSVIIGRDSKGWSTVDPKTGDQNAIFDFLGGVYIIGDGRYVLADYTDSVSLYDTEQKKRSVTMDLGNQIYRNGRHRFAFSTDPESKTLWFWGVNYQELQRWDIESGVRLTPYASPVKTRSETMIFPEMSGNRLAIVDYDTVHVFSVSEQGLTLLWTRSFEDDRIHRVLWRPNSDDLIVVTDRTSSLVTVGSAGRGVSLGLPTYPMFKYVGSDGLSVLCSEERNTFHFDPASSHVNWYVAARGPECQVLESNLVGVISSDGGQVFAILMDMKTRQVMHQIVSENFSRFVAVSADSRYIASIIGDSTIVVRDMVDTTRKFTIDGRRHGYSFAVDFSNNGKELVIVGAVSGSIWNLDAFSASVDSQVSLRSYEVYSGNQKFASNLNGDVVVRMNPFTIGIYSRSSNSITQVRDFTPNRIKNLEMGADNTVLCVTDSGDVYILNNALETMCKDTYGRNESGVVTVAWNSKKSTFIAHTNQNELVFLRYSPVTSISNSVMETSTQDALLVRTFSITLSNTVMNNVRVYSSIGLDVTELVHVSQNGDDVELDGDDLSADAYIVVDGSSNVSRRILYMP